MGAADPLGTLKKSVVKVMTVSDMPDYEQPWQTLGAASSTGSGAIVETPQGLHILTNAHVVEDATFIEVRREGQSRKTVAEVVGYGEACDLALLSVEDTAFFEGAMPIPIGELPSLGDPVTVLGFPIGGEQLSVTEGVVSRIELTTYVQTERNLLSVQIDAAINPGNSGGPVVLDGKLAGIAFQSLEEAENIGYVIPTPVIQHFLQDVESPPYDGFPYLGLSVQHLESNAHRKHLGLPRSRRGVLVTQVHYGSSCWNVLQRGDVLLKVDGAHDRGGWHREARRRFADRVPARAFDALRRGRNPPRDLPRGGALDPPRHASTLPAARTWAYPRWPAVVVRLRGSSIRPLHAGLAGNVGRELAIPRTGNARIALRQRRPHVARAGGRAPPEGARGQGEQRLPRVGESADLEGPGATRAQVV